MSAVSIELARRWRPESLSVAAGDVATAQKRVDREVQAMRRALDAATRSWEGPAAQAAADRAAREATTGFKLADALDTARAALETGAADIGGARSRLLATIGGAEAQGFAVSGDGSVTAPTLPPVMTSPENAAAAIDERNAEQQRLNDHASSLASDIGRALQSVDDADRRTADALTGIQIPQTLESAVRAYLERARTSRDLLGALGGYGAGGVALALQLKKAVGIFGKTGAYARFLRHASAPISDYQTLLRNFAGADDALREFSYGKANGGFARFLIGSRAARLAGRAFLPLTVATGALDAVTGGGYDGARGWATRGFGLAGAAGAGTLLLAGASLGPVGVAVAGGAVLAYGAWSAGNYVWDHREQIGEFLEKSGAWVADRATAAWDTTTQAVSDAKDWADDTLEAAGDKARDLGKGALDVVSFGLL